MFTTRRPGFMSAAIRPAREWSESASVAKALRPRRLRATACFAWSALVASSLFGPQAHAEGATEIIYSPVFCKASGGTYWIFSSGHIGNLHPTDTMKVFCPLTHEVKHGHSGKVQIAVVQASGRSRVRCSAYFNHALLESGWIWNGWQGQDQLGSQETTITLSGSDFLEGSHMILCEVPPKDFQATRFDGVSRIKAYSAGVD